MTRVFTPEENSSWAKQLPGKMTSACLAIRHEDMVLMVKASYKDHWTFPGGIVDDNESPEQAVLREAREETGLLFEEDGCQLLGIVYTASNGRDRDRFNFGFTVDVAGNNLDLSVPNEEIEEAKWVAIDEVGLMSGNTQSYKSFQDILLGVRPAPSYIEIHPAS